MDARLFVTAGSKASGTGRGACGCTHACAQPLGPAGAQGACCWQNLANISSCCRLQVFRTEHWARILGNNSNLSLMSVGEWRTPHRHGTACVHRPACCVHRSACMHGTSGAAAPAAPCLASADPGAGTLHATASLVARHPICCCCRLARCSNHPLLRPRLLLQSPVPVAPARPSARSADHHDAILGGGGGRRAP